MMGNSSLRVPWFVRQWRVPLNRCIYTAFSYMIFLFYIILYVAETSSTLLIDILTAIWIVSYTCRDLGTGKEIGEGRTIWRLAYFIRPTLRKDITSEYFLSCSFFLT